MCSNCKTLATAKPQSHARTMSDAAAAPKEIRLSEYAVYPFVFDEVRAVVTVARNRSRDALEALRRIRGLIVIIRVYLSARDDDDTVLTMA